MTPHCMTDTRASMRRAKTAAAAKQALVKLNGRLEDAKFIQWKALEQSLQREYDDCLAIARERGLA